jgi:hypothetical protein
MNDTCHGSNNSNTYGKTGSSNSNTYGKTEKKVIPPTERKARKTHKKTYKLTTVCRAVI